jgi:outer membrane protein
MMKKILILLCAVVFTAATSFAQRYLIIDTRYIFDQMPEYKTVQKTIDNQAATWQKEIDSKRAELDKLYSDYDEQQSMMSENQRRKKEDELFNREKELRDLQQKRFGFEGDLFKKRGELMKPLQDKIADAVKKLVTANGYDLVFDKSEGKSIIFADQKLDKSDEILKILKSK